MGTTSTGILGRSSGTRGRSFFGNRYSSGTRFKIATKALRLELERITRGTDGSQSARWDALKRAPTLALHGASYKALVGEPEGLFGWDEFDWNIGDEGF
jgi:hypothetical protein